MALVLKDRVKETTTTTGTGAVTLNGAVPGFQSFAAIGDTNTTYYAITGDAQWEVGIGTYAASGTLLSRDTVLASSSGSLVNFSAGTKDVFVTYPAEKAVYANGTGPLGATTIGASVISLTNPSAVTFPRFNADNTTSALDAANFRTAIGAGTVASVAASGGTTGLTFSGSPITTSGTLAIAGTLVVANGGTGGAAAATAGAVAYGTGSAYAFTAAGTAGRVLISNGSSAPTFGGVDGGTF